MTPSTLARVRCECTTPQDLHELLGAVQWRFPTSESIGDSIADLCALIETDFDTTTPTLDDIAAHEDFRRRDLAERKHGISI